LLQSSDVDFLTNVRLFLFFLLLILIYYSTKQSSRVLERAWRLPIIYPQDNETSKGQFRERDSLLRTLSIRWSLLTVVDYSLAVLLVYELVLGFAAAEQGIAYYFAVHIPSAAAVSAAIGLLLAAIVIRFRNPFSSRKIEPLKYLLKNLESLASAVRVADTAVPAETEDIFLRIVKQEIERFMDFREMGDAECGRLLEYLSGIDGIVGQAASTLLWPHGF